MEITLTDTGKRYSREWIFRHVSLHVREGGRYAITGPNGSGKSTLLQVMAGAVLPSEGRVEARREGRVVPEDQLHRHIALAAPYLELVEELSGREQVAFHARFKPLTLPGDELLTEAGLAEAADKQIRYYSSGMKQRLKLALAFHSHSEVVLLDEPFTNLDAAGIRWYRQLLERSASGRLILIGSNDPSEYEGVEEVISMNALK